MSMIDIAAAISARRLCRHPAVTASMDSLVFLRPVTSGDVVSLRAQVNRAWRSSMEVEVEVLAESLQGPPRHCATAYLTFVALGPDRSPIPVPEVVPVTRVEQQAYRDAEARRQLRLEKRGSPSGVVGGRPLPSTPSTDGLRASDTFTESTRVVMPTHANSYDTAFGGDLMAWCEDLASISAMRVSKSPVATACVDALHFRAPAFVGDVVQVQAQVNRAFGSSVEVGVRLLAHTPTTEAQEDARVCVEATMVFVRCVDPATGTRPQLPKVLPETPAEEARWQSAGERRRAREEERAALH